MWTAGLIGTTSADSGCAIGTTRDGIEKLMTPGLTCGNVRIAFMERVTRVELAFSAWEIDLARFADLRFC